jgi:hypothetical protein
MYIMSFPPAGEWNLIDTATTGSGGRASFNIPDEHKLDVGIYPSKMVVRSVNCDVYRDVIMTSFLEPFLEG